MSGRTQRKRSLIRSVGGLLLGLVVALGPPARAEELTLQLKVPEITEPPRRAIWHADDGGPRRLLIPALEVPATNVGIWSFDLAIGKDYARINPYTMWRNLKGPWIWDDDTYASNAFGHPYHGSLYFTAARSSGFGFWSSIPFALFGSGLWELFFETEPPSKNDIITTTIGGIMLGEILHRTSLLILDDGYPTIFRSIASFAVEPMGGLNRLLFGRPANDFYPHAPQFLRFGAGVSANLRNYSEVAGVRTNQSATPEAHLSLDLYSGLPGDSRWRPKAPFDHFTLQARAGITRTPYVAFFMSGLLLGAAYGEGSYRGVWGLFGGFDYANPNTLRIETVSAGVGTAAQWRFSDRLALLPTLVLSGVPFGQGGNLQPAVVNRDYHYGPGAQVRLDLQLVDAELGRVGLTGRYYALTGSFLGEGWERIGYFSAFSEVAVTRNFGVGLEAFLASRNTENTQVAQESSQHAAQLRVYLTFMSDGGFRALTRR